MDHYTARKTSRGFDKDPVACVYPRIWVGAGCQLTPALVQQLSITHVINCAHPQDSQPWFRSDRYQVLYAIDDPRVNILHWYPAFETTMLKFLRDPECSNVYVHCQAGINRSAFLAVAFVIDHFGMEWRELVQSMIQQRPCCLTNPSFWAQVKEFAKTRARKHGSVPQ